MKKAILSSVFVGLGLMVLTGCSDKIPKPEPVDWNNKDLVINKNFLIEKDFKVPKDPFLGYKSWTFQINTKKINNDLFRNEEIIKTFLVAHNSSDIIIIGNDLNTLNEYKQYFMKNQVSANIKLQTIDSKNNDNSVNLLFFNNLISE